MSATIKRFVTTCDCMSPAEWGDYVLHADHLASHAYDEEKERALFEAAFRTSDLAGAADYGRWRYTDKLVDYLWYGWLACARSRAKAAGCE